MKIGEQIRFIVINMMASSLYSLIADGKNRSTSLGRATWPRCRFTVTRKGSILCVVGLVTPKQESAPLLTTRMTASLATPGLDLVQEDVYHCVLFFCSSVFC